MTILLSAVAFILLLSVLVVIHEWGHFAAARKAGVVVEEFGFGLPPKARTLFKQKGTEFTLNWIPFGGFVRLKGENAMTEKERRAPGSFSSASIPARVCILVAGVFMNFLLAVSLLTVGFSAGNWIPTYFTIDEMRAAQDGGVLQMQLGVVIDKVISGGGAAKVGVPEKSLLISVDGTPVQETLDVQEIQAGKTLVTYVVKTGEGFIEEETFRVTLDEGKSGVLISLLPFDISAPDRNVWEAFVLALREAKVMTKQTVIGIGQLFSSLARTAKVPEGITGLVGIAQLTHASVQAGFMTYLRLVALLSLSLAILNILPFPALDGGRLLFVLIEGITGRPVNRRLEVTVNMVGFIFLLALIFLITFYDVIRLF
ncbi:MAG: site-2 protease family protein [bacterium]|nr:site-2 protease family protein [bacterium]